MYGVQCSTKSWKSWKFQIWEIRLEGVEACAGPHIRSGRAPRCPRASAKHSAASQDVIPPNHRDLFDVVWQICIYQWKSMKFIEKSRVGHLYIWNPKCDTKYWQFSKIKKYQKLQLRLFYILLPDFWLLDPRLEIFLLHFFPGGIFSDLRFLTRRPRSQISDSRVGLRYWVRVCDINL